MMNLLHRTSRRLGARLLPTTLAVLLAACLEEGPNAARAENKNGGKAAPKKPNKPPAPKPVPPAQIQNPAAMRLDAEKHLDHKDHEVKAAPALPKRHANAGKHPPVLLAMRDLEQAFAVLETHPDPLLGLYRLGAMERIREAYVHLNLGVGGDLGRNQPESTPLRGLPPGSDFPHVRTALGKVRDAQDKLKEVPLNMNGQRRAAVINLNLAVYQLDLAMKKARQLGE